MMDTHYFCALYYMIIRYIDTHAHLNLSAFTDDVDVVAARCVEKGVGMINIGTKHTTSARAVELAAQYDHLYAIVGLHPIQTVPGTHDEDEIGEGGQQFVSRGEVFDLAAFRTLAQSPKVVGIGECGFDYWHCPPETYEIQEAAFLAQIALANELQLPLMIHTRGPKPGETSPTGRSVYEDVYDILKQHATVPFNVHFYAGTLDEAKRFIELGGTISFTGVITFAKSYEEIIREIPLEYMHAETDCPYVAPVPYRGQRCEPHMVIEVYKKIAALKGCGEDEVRQVLFQNAARLYRI
jgi:TatD DNase family protein